MPKAVLDWNPKQKTNTHECALISKGLTKWENRKTLLKLKNYI